MEKTLLFKETAKWERLGDTYESMVSYPLESFCSNVAGSHPTNLKGFCFLKLKSRLNKK